ncbi:MAG: anthranilate synthase component I [Cyanobacteria bacterium SID2]|nr:anthranilate synthase component I [Cyanobacteria bacterium SID2]MBP0006672.1 anthranilate synthase component I [Cyanobacteria bacterium SBC]
MNLSNSWFWRSIPLKSHTASDVFRVLFLDDDISTLLESPHRCDNPNLVRFSICAGRPREVRGKRQLYTPSIGTILPFLKGLLAESSNLDRSQSNPPIDRLPFTGGWLGWLGYDVAWEIERLPHTKSDSLPFPPAYWYEPERFAVLDRVEDRLWFAASSPQQLDEMQNAWENRPTSEIHEFSERQTRERDEKITYLSSKEDYETMVRRAQNYIRAGDIFQANLSLRFETQTHQHPWQIYQALHHINPSPFASYWNTPWGAVVSCSPERLVKLRDGIAQTRPIAGTRPRGETPERDRTLEAELLDNRKENAEHVMLVDLERNDLGRVCQWGSVKVDELLVIERYSHVMHLVSNVVGEVAIDRDAIDVVRALFPGGTITGCPKVRCMEIIEELEPVRRSLFYGSCGYLDRRGFLDLNILIRTLLVSQGRVWGQVGAGIVADSDPEREWFESLSKAQAQLTALRSIV